MTDITPRKLRVVADERAWANVRTHKMGWLRPGDIIEIFELYTGWTQFRPIEGCKDLIPLTEGVYDQYWIDPDSESSFSQDETEPVPEPPVPEPEPGDSISFAKAGEAFDTLARFLVQAIRRA